MLRCAVLRCVLPQCLSSSELSSALNLEMATAGHTRGDKEVALGSGESETGTNRQEGSQ